MNDKDVNANDYASAADFSDDGFWTKVGNVAKKAGKEVIGTALKAYYVARDEDTPIWAKTSIYGALAYFGLPIDAIPDIVPMVGYSDDLAVLLTAIKATTLYVKPEHEEEAERKLSDWFN
ncbi:YkvA family protein [Photobacterium damselae]|uniref:YkvA family protein n=1 Tax=Photobacterium damselae TaxID=38293 RepID=UPI00165E60E9|nr:YkvA family protein [Photobacterium damselae]QOQ68453.1 DUF1232 domain-containing protein [Photobacterium damselae subsp. damselae]